MLKFLACAIALTLCLSSSALPQVMGPQESQTDEHGRWENGFTEAWFFESNKYDKEKAAAARERWAQAGASAGTRRSGWEGIYQIDMSVRAHVLRWSANAGFVFFNVNTCMANVDDLDYGDVVSDTPSHIELVSKRHQASENRRKLVKVKWGEQRYLIEEHAVPSFCDYVVGLDEQSGAVEAVFLSHLDDNSEPTAALPTVPPEYRQFVRHPIDAVITKVGKSYVEVRPDNEWWNDSVTPVSISVGSNQGVIRGMNIQILDSDEINENVEIMRVGANYSHGIIVRSVRKRPGVKLNEWDDGKDAPQQPITVGWGLTTSVHKQLLRADERNTAWEAKQPKRQASND